MAQNQYAFVIKRSAVAGIRTRVASLASSRASHYTTTACEGVFFTPKKYI